MRENVSEAMTYIATLTFAYLTKWPLLSAVAMVMGHVGTVGHLLLRAVISVVEVKHVAYVTEETRGGHLTCDVTVNQTWNTRQ